MERQTSNLPSLFTTPSSSVILVIQSCYLLLVSHHKSSPIQVMMMDSNCTVTLSDIQPMLTNGIESIDACSARTSQKEHLKVKKPTPY